MLKNTQKKEISVVCLAKKCEKLKKYFANDDAFYKKNPYRHKEFKKMNPVHCPKRPVYKLKYPIH